MQFRTCSHGYAISTLIRSRREQLTVTFIHRWNILAAYNTHPRAVFWKSDSLLTVTVLMFHWDVGASIIPVFWAFVMFQRLWQHLLRHSSLTCWRERESTPLCITPVILTSDRLLPVAVCLAYSPDHSTAAPVKTHLNVLCLRVSGRK